MTGAASAVRAAVAVALREDVGLAATLNGVFEGPAVRASPPFATVEDALATDWSVKEARGRELRIAVSIRDEGETPERLATLADTAERAIEAAPRTIDGWHVASLVFQRSRLAGEGPGRWLAVIEYRVRVLAEA